MAELARIRNFCVIAHVDHGKTTLSDRLLETTGTVPLRLLRDQMLDSMAPEHASGRARPVPLPLRGAAPPGGVRGRRAPRRRVAGHRGADARERLPRGRA